MFEYAGCGVPVITRRRDEVNFCFKEDSEVLMYDSHDELIDKVQFYLKNKDLLHTIGLKAYDRCLKEHDIKFRVDEIIPFIKSL